MAQRYDVWSDYDAQQHHDKDDSGEWVRYDDHAAEITRLKAELKAERELADLLAESLKWMLSETETNRGDEPMDDHRGLSWNQINEYWIHHEDIAQDALTEYGARRNK